MRETFHEIFRKRKAVLSSRFFQPYRAYPDGVRHGLRIDRAVVISGRSLVNIERDRRDLAPCVCRPSCLRTRPSRCFPERMVVIATGSQGETVAFSFSRIASGEHRQLSIMEGDTVIMSSSHSGNARAVNRLINQMYRMGPMLPRRNAPCARFRSWSARRAPPC